MEKGLNPTVKKALDVVRVVGDDAVRPGALDLHDDADTAQKLLRLVNAIADQMISHPKSVDALYQSLPPGRLEDSKRST